MSDLISRQDAIDAVRLESAKRGLLGRGDILDILSSLPSAMREPTKEERESVAEYVGKASTPTGENFYDLISRQDAIEAMCGDCDGGQVYPKCDQVEWCSEVNVLFALPSAESVQGWIPCSERLPGKGEVVLITNGKGNVRCGQYRSEYDVRDGTHYWWWKGKTVESVIAWMPLPDPYKGE